MSDSRIISIRFGENLRRCRKGIGISQEELGDRSGLHRTEIGLLERGQRIPQLDTIVKLAGGLAITPRELIEGMVWKPGHARPGKFVLQDPQERP